jgi:FKBP-type peptidyl-prolyl cis-trans isomerase (trigger factor)
MNFPESIVAENLNEILRRAVMRLQQEHIHVRELRQDSSEATPARALLEKSLDTYERLKAYRAKFDRV